MEWNFHYVMEVSYPQWCTSIVCENLALCVCAYGKWWRRKNRVIVETLFRYRITNSTNQHWTSLMACFNHEDNMPYEVKLARMHLVLNVRRLNYQKYLLLLFGELDVVWIVFHFTNSIQCWWNGNYLFLLLKKYE